MDRAGFLFRKSGGARWCAALHLRFTNCCPGYRCGFSVVVLSPFWLVLSFGCLALLGGGLPFCASESLGCFLPAVRCCLRLACVRCSLPWCWGCLARVGAWCLAGFSLGSVLSSVALTAPPACLRCLWVSSPSPPASLLLALLSLASSSRCHCAVAVCDVVSLSLLSSVRRRC